MKLIIESACDLCGATGQKTFGYYFPGYQLPPPEEVSAYLPPGWQYVEGVLLCPAHSYRLILERERHSPPYTLLIEEQPEGEIRPFIWPPPKLRESS